MNVRSRDRIAVTKEKPKTATVVALGKGRGNDKDEVSARAPARDNHGVRRSPRAPCRVWNTFDIIAGQWRHTQTLRPHS
jgi:hypothetical protein